MGTAIVEEEMEARSKIRRDAILRAATEVFLEQGYDATSIDAVIERAGGSKRNIYNEFGNKQGLFSALVERSADTVLSSLKIKERADGDLQTTLIEFGQRLMTAYMSATLIGIYRIAVTETNRFPDLAKLFYDQGPGRATLRLAEVLQKAQERREIELVDCAGAADHFVGMIRGNLHLQVVLGLRPVPSRADQKRAVRLAVDIFLKGLRPNQLNK